MLSPRNAYATAQTQTGLSGQAQGVSQTLLKQLFLPYVSGLKCLRYEQKPGLECWIHGCTPHRDQGGSSASSLHKPDHRLPFPATI